MPPLRLYWIDAKMAGRLAVMPRPHPRSFMDLKAAGVDVLASLLEPHEAEQAGLSAQADLCAAAHIDFLHLPVVDHGVPRAIESVASAAARLGAELDAGRGVAVHCWAGQGRSPLLAAAVLIERGMGAVAATDLISAARGMRVPEMAAQQAWLDGYERRRSGA
jgi:protein-tyrosine phosphatase